MKVGSAVGTNVDGLIVGVRVVGSKVGTAVGAGDGRTVGAGDGGADGSNVGV